MIKVRVPATSANIGPGFDTLGIALNLFNEYGFELISEGLEFDNVEEQFRNEDNIIIFSMKKVFSKYNFQYGGIKLTIFKQDIPVSRGLGSSSSCIVAGIIGAFSLMNREIDKSEVFKLATEIEGHPDNVCPAIFGGMVVSISNGESPIYNSVNVTEGIKFVALVPRFKLSTKEARGVLPSQISLKDGIFNVSRAALLVSCFQNGNYELLKVATEDRFHQNYRSKLIEGFDTLYNYSYEVGALACFLSGAGPTLMTICYNDNKNFLDKIQEYIDENKLNWDIKELEIYNEGAQIF